MNLNVLNQMGKIYIFHSVTKGFSEESTESLPHSITKSILNATFSCQSLLRYFLSFNHTTLPTYERPLTAIDISKKL